MSKKRDWQRGQTMTPKKRKITPESSRKILGSILRSPPMLILAVPPSKTCISGLKTQLLEPKNNFT